MKDNGSGGWWWRIVDLRLYSWIRERARLRYAAARRSPATPVVASCSHLEQLLMTGFQRRRDGLDSPEYAGRRSLESCMKHGPSALLRCCLDPVSLVLFLYRISVSERKDPMGLCPSGSASIYVLHKVTLTMAQVQRCTVRPNSAGRSCGGQQLPPPWYSV